MPKNQQYVYRSPSLVQPPGFDLATEIYAWRLDYAMAGVSGYPWYPVRGPHDGDFRTPQEALAFRSACPILSSSEATIRPVRTTRAVRDWQKHTPFAQIDDETRGFPPIPRDGTIVLRPHQSHDELIVVVEAAAHDACRRSQPTEHS
jgi:hypothetical protein